jgi:hypothetical protein
MSYTFHIAHSTDARTRIRQDGNISDKAVLSEIAEQMAQIPGVDQAVPRMTTGSIIIEHETVKWSAIEPQLTDNLYLEFSTPPRKPAFTGIMALNKGLDQVDGALKGMNTDLRSLTVFMLAVLAITQALRGQVVVSATSLLWYAFSVASKARKTSGDKPEAPVDAAE